VGEHGDLVLESADGARFGAFHAHPQAPSNRAIVIMPDVRGLHHFYRDLALRWAEAGLHAVTIDYFGRTAGIGERGEEFPYRDHMEKIDFATIGQDASAAVSWLREHTEATAVFTVGFCFGGAMSWRQAASGDDLAGSVGFYGIPSRVVDVAEDIAVPLLVLAAGKDFTPVEETQAFAERVRGNGVEVTVAVYPEAPHSFFDRTFAQYEQECADAWHQMLAFVDRNAV
jgi:carboxymethylenebutenolidase